MNQSAIEVRGFYLTFLLSIVLPWLRATGSNVTPLTMDSLRTELQQSATTRDSLGVLYNMFDAGSTSEKKAMASTLYGTAKRLGDRKAQLDILRNLGNLYLGNDSIQKRILGEAEMMPESPEQKETVMFLRLLIVTSNSLMESTEKKDEFLKSALNEYRVMGNDTSELKKIELLYTLCVYLGSSVQGDLLPKYLDEIETLIDGLPYGLYVFHNMFYAHAAVVYTRNQQYEKAVEADRQLLEIIDDLEKDYREKGRKFKNLNRNRYICYRRMLFNFRVLSPEEIEEAWRRIQELAAEEPSISADMEKNHLAETFYQFASKNYEKAIPMMNELVEEDLKGNNYLKLKLYKMIAEAAEATDDPELQRTALSKYIDLLSEAIRSKRQEQYRELQLIYEMNNLTAKDIKLLEQEEEQLKKEQRKLTALWIIAGALLIFLLVVCLRYRRVRKRLKALAEATDKLRRELTAKKK